MPEASPAGPATAVNSDVRNELRSERNNRRGRPPHVGFQIGHLRHRIFVKVEAPRLDEIDQRVARDVVALHRVEQRRRDRVGARLAITFAIDDVAPPLQADFARQRRVRHVADACHLGIEGIKRMERAPPVRRRKQRGDEAIAVDIAHQLGAIGECILHGRQLNRINGLSALRVPVSFASFTKFRTRAPVRKLAREIQCRISDGQAF